MAKPIGRAKPRRYDSYFFRARPDNATLLVRELFSHQTHVRLDICVRSRPQAGLGRRQASIEPHWGPIGNDGPCSGCRNLTTLYKAASDSRIPWAIHACWTMPCSVMPDPSNGKLMHADSTIPADIVLSVSRSARSAWCARGDALSTATGLSTNGSKLTSQSSAFLMVPVTPCAYSGLAIKRASADET
jgi:hypothetical protein